MSLKDIKLIVLDVDGTLTDGAIIIDNNKNETKRFNAKDGAGVILARSVGIDFLILTGRDSICVAKRAEELGITNVIQGKRKKAESMKEFISTNGYSYENVAYMGDDVNDLPAMEFAGCKACPGDASEDVKNVCDYVLHTRGGDGAVREFVEILLKAQGLWEDAIKKAFY